MDESLRIFSLASAKKHFAAAHKLFPRSMDPLRGLEQIAIRENDKTAIADVLRRQADADVDDDGRITILLWLAKIEEEDFRKPELAAKTLERVIAISPGHSVAIEALERTYGACARMARARSGARTRRDVDRRSAAARRAPRAPRRGARDEDGRRASRHRHLRTPPEGDARRGDRAHRARASQREDRRRARCRAVSRAPRRPRAGAVDARPHARHRRSAPRAGRLGVGAAALRARRVRGSLEPGGLERAPVGRARRGRRRAHRALSRGARAQDGDAARPRRRVRRARRCARRRKATPTEHVAPTKKRPPPTPPTRLRPSRS